MTIYVLSNINLAGLGGPMGTEHTSVRWTKYFSTLAKAKAYAERNFKYKNTNAEKIEWSRSGNGCVVSQDLRWVQYEIQRKKVL